MWRGLVCACVGAGWASSALAGGKDFLRNDWSGEYPASRNLSVTVAPMSLFEGRAPRLDLTAELRTGEGRSVAVTSSMPLPRLGPSMKAERDVGLQIRDYVVGGFDNGLFVGGQVGFTNLDILHFRTEGARFGPMAGTKVSLSLFTVEGRASVWLGMTQPGKMSIEPRVDFAAGFTF